MSDDDTFHGDLIRRLGGKAKIAVAFGVDHVEKWHTRGIPSRYWHMVVELGANMDPPVVITFEELARTKPASTEAA